MEKIFKTDMFLMGSLDETNYTWQRTMEDRKVQKLKAWEEKKKTHRKREEKYLFQ